MRLSVIIPCYNAAADLPAQLEALASQQWSEAWEVVVADNGSTDGSREVVERFRAEVPGLRMVDASDTRGPAHARNVGAREAHGEWLAFVDSDDVVAPGWIAAIGDALRDAEFVASRHEFGKLNPPIIERTRQNEQSEGLQSYRYPPFLPHASGSGLGVHRRVHENVGGFDEDLANLQDTDYCWRIQLAGTKLHFAGDAVVHYRFRETLLDIYIQGVNYGEHNVLLYKKYRAHGMPTANWKRGVRSWMSIALSIPDLFEEERRLRWVRRFGFQFGRLKGCVKYRVLAP